MDEKDAPVDLIVVGAGIGGLCAAKTYLELAPGSNVIILEARKTLGGVWAEENLYEGLKTNNLYGTYEYSDYYMDPKIYDVKEGWHIPGRVMYDYLTDYARHFDILRCIHYLTTVDEIEKLQDGWLLRTNYANGNGSMEKTYRSKKLIMCHGLASRPNPVNLPGHQNFDRPVFNHGALRQQGEALANDPNVKSVTVVGASKIGYDAVYMFATHGKKVDWVVRKSGGGPVWMSSPWVKLGPWTVMLEHVACMRFFTWFSPCIWGCYDGFGWIRGFLARTRIGRWLTDNLWEKMRFDVVDFNGYRKEEQLKHLEPFESLFWSARVGILNYASDPHDLLRSGQVTLHKTDITLSPNGTITHDDNTTHQTDAVIQITGWQLTPTITWSPPGIDASIGIPSKTYTPSELDFWASLDARADAHILRQFPRLAHPPARKLPFTQPITPMRLYRGIAPPGLTATGDRSLCFLKMVHCTSNLILAETQALWTFAYLSGNLAINEADVYWHTALTSRFGGWRYPWGFSRWYPEFVYDAVPYADMLLGDLGVRRHRKGGWWNWREWFEGYTVHDYRGIRGDGNGDG
ncbi:hypothetical protein M409DRAFT_63824 [Zasmidium cellare ATCC 36951]|uniref:FAD/NAD(P)-binding domain-containing protein n=1 Tax=Zasmidium cellare ATCC 36951 TaxID=1080233 RepID=A0A6A6CX03_ZASCE|nr:uncharacterized protein M409DRAFT_63824 [Zasmidium cellare ATCC 36951]KAF2170748.1 hypothetical protein M409DRAFT_63824 [Zasmidium cellare ATCC 36951]